jgi:hypothetical protein
MKSLPVARPGCRRNGATEQREQAKLIKFTKAEARQEFGPKTVNKKPSVQEEGALTTLGYLDLKKQKQRAE